MLCPYSSPSQPSLPIPKMLAGDGHTGINTSGHEIPMNGPHYSRTQFRPVPGMPVVLIMNPDSEDMQLLQYGSDAAPCCVRGCIERIGA